MIPDYCEALTAYRCWNVHPNGLMVGQAHIEPWQPYAAFVGRCGMALEAHVKDGAWVPVPAMGCDCGIHALKESAAAEQRLIDEIVTNRDSFMVFSSPYGYVQPRGRVWGAVKLWGRVVEHEIGYRAEFAYPSMLFCQDAKLAATVSALYGVPCEVKSLTIPAREESTSFTVSGYWYAAPQYPTIYPSILQPLAPMPQGVLAQVKALGASRHQRKLATKREADKEAAAQRKRDLISNYINKGCTA